MTFKVIDGGGPEGRDRLLAEREFQNALRETSANMLRIIRGAGKPYALLSQMRDVLNSAVRLREVTGHVPTETLIRTLEMPSQVELLLERKNQGEIVQGSTTSWETDGTFDRLDAEDAIRSGALQFIASELLGQMTQRSAGHSEMREGIRELNKVREERRRQLAVKQSKPAKPTRAKTKPKL